MTDHEFDVYWYKTLSVVVTKLLQNDLQPLNKKAIEPLFSLENDYKKLTTKPTASYNKSRQLLNAIAYVVNSKEKSAPDLAEIHENIRDELKLLYALYARRLSKSQLIFNNYETSKAGLKVSNKEKVFTTKKLLGLIGEYLDRSSYERFRGTNKSTYLNLPSSDEKSGAGLKVSNGEKILISRALLSMICDYLDSSSYEKFRRTNKSKYRKLPPLPLLPINYQNCNILGSSNSQDMDSNILILPDGRVVDYHSDTIRVWDLDKPKSLENPILKTFQGIFIMKLDILPDGKILLNTRSEPYKLVLNLDRPLSDDNPLVLKNAHEHITIILPDGKIASAWQPQNNNDVLARNIQVWDLKKSIDNTNPILLEGHQDKVSALNVLGDGKIVSTSNDKTIRVWDLNSPRGYGTNPIVLSHQHNILALKILPNGKIVSQTLGDRVNNGAPDFGALSHYVNMRIWSLGKPINCIELRNLKAYSGLLMVTLPDGRVVDYYSDIIRVWDLDKPISPTNPTVFKCQDQLISGLKVVSNRTIVFQALGGSIGIVKLDEPISLKNPIVLSRDRHLGLSFDKIHVLSSGKIIGKLVDRINRVEGRDRVTILVWDVYKSINNSNPIVLVDNRNRVGIDKFTCDLVGVLPDERIVTLKIEILEIIIQIWDLSRPNKPVELKCTKSMFYRKSVKVLLLPNGKILSITYNSRNGGDVRVWGSSDKEQNVKINQQLIQAVINEYGNKVRNRKISFGYAGKRVNNEILPDNLAIVITKIQRDANTLALSPNLFIEAFAKEIKSQTRTVNNDVKSTKILTSRDSDVELLYLNPLFTLKTLFETDVIKNF
ncbi:hypothetical protein EDC55_1071 [Allofrancisella inopinata]|uniref:WD40 repeat protein n=1 Tax=Allofrancisella inopinata TaxID=1085647 RepID=A0AAE6YH60_9GAMM|nr:hypothetical protein [Allofrancisella inopinata]QIV95471.1 hypothetical protein E4K63_00900 [Allofrancisella inopinata]TDT72606.1 hypothetical protein EDC55_1071 [Allofrancisella inopinata]